MFEINTWRDKMVASLDRALTNDIEKFILRVRQTSGIGNKLIFIGNGGSAAIASHMAEDYSKNGNLRAISFNDAALLTCFANDYGYEHMFTRAIDCYGDIGDTLIAISSSGKSPNIINGCINAKASGINVITFSGFEPDNSLREIGDLNFYVAAKEYGLVEISHLAILHCALDLHCEMK